PISCLDIGTPACIDREIRPYLGDKVATGGDIHVLAREVDVLFNRTGQGTGDNDVDIDLLQFQQSTVDVLHAKVRVGRIEQPEITLFVCSGSIVLNGETSVLGVELNVVRKRLAVSLAGRNGDRLGMAGEFNNVAGFQI